MPPWKIFANTTPEMATMQLVLLILRPVCLQLIPKHLILLIDSSLRLLYLSSPLIQAGFDNTFNFLLKMPRLSVFSNNIRLEEMMKK